MVKIKDIFAKDITRNIRGVIKIGQDTEKIKQQELEEYVVTDELKRNFTRFFDAYNQSINNYTDEMGVWISGFFGSGKSHFLKIISYLLENDLVSNRRAIDYFLEDGKFEDNHLQDAINKATSVPTDVALFNIDSKADSNAANDQSAILNVFLKVFNEKLGYSSIAEIANMERLLDKRGQYDAFKKAFEELSPENTHSTWEEARKDYAIMTSRIKEALIKSGAVKKEDAENYVNNLQQTKFSMDPTEFGKLVRDYLDKKGNDQHFVFLADEVGQFIGDNTNRMLNLQTIVEQLGIQCQGRAWVVVTAQQQMDNITKHFSETKRDFSKIQGRFNTLINMSSANADEVIRKRILAKKPLAIDELKDIYSKNEFNINNKINFSDSIKRQKYQDSEEFVSNYPFVPYQFELLKDVLTEVRKKGANGSHMSDGERSMLATFQEATIRYKDDDIGTLIPFSAFFTGMREFLSHDHQVVFTKAIGDTYLNPDKEEFNFNIQVLAVLFMVRYVDSYPSTIENITTLLLSNINQDRVALTDKVKEALSKLLRQNLIQKKIDTYEFLTDSEQEVNAEINAIEVEDRKVAQEIGKYLINSNDISSKYTYPNMKNKYIFEFNMLIDEGVALNRQSNNLSVDIYSPLTSSDYHEIDFKQKASDGQRIIVVLKDNNSYIENYRRVEKINEYLTKPESNSDSTKKSIALLKGKEAQDIEHATQAILKNELIDADIYVLDSVLPHGNSFEARLEEAKKQLINNSYRDLSYITAVKSEQDVLDILKGKTEVNLVNDDEQAIKEIINYIGVQAANMNNVSFASVIKHFEEIPYGYKPVDLAWMTAKAFVDGKLKIFFNNQQITLEQAQSNPKTVQRYFLNKNSMSKLTLKPVKELTNRQKQAAKDFVDVVLEKRLVFNAGETSEQVANRIQKWTKNYVERLKNLSNKKYDTNTPYPGHALLHEGIELLSKISDAKDSDRVFYYISKDLDEMEDWHDDLEDKAILEFYGSLESKNTQQEIWDRSKKYSERFELSKTFINNDELKEIAEKIKNELTNDNFANSISELKDLNEQFADKYNTEIQNAYDSTMEYLNRTETILRGRVSEANFPQRDRQNLYAQMDQIFITLRQQANNFSNSDQNNAYISLIGLKNDITKESNMLKYDIGAISRRIADEAREKAQEAKKVQEPIATQEKQEVVPEQEPVIPVQKISVSKDIDDIVKISSWKITNEQDIDRYLQELKQQLEQELKDTDILNIDFK